MQPPDNMSDKFAEADKAEEKRKALAYIREKSEAPKVLVKEPRNRAERRQAAKQKRKK